VSRLLSVAFGSQDKETCAHRRNDEVLEREQSMGTVTSERPAWPSRLLAFTFYLGLAPLLALFRLQRRSAYLQHHFARAVVLAGVLAFLLLLELAGWVACMYGQAHHEDVMTIHGVHVIEIVASAVLLIPWALAWLLAVVVALRGSVWRLPLLWRLGGKRWTFRVALVGNVALGLAPAAVCAMTLHALAITREADDRPAAVYMLYHRDAPVPRWVFALGFYRIALAARERWGPDSVVVAPLTEENLQQAMRHGRFVFLGTHGAGGDVTTPLVLVEPVKGRSGYSLKSIARASPGDRFQQENARRIEVGGDLQFVYVSACDGGEKEDVWRAALTPAEVKTFARTSYADEHAFWMWWDGPGRIWDIDAGPRLAPTQYRLGVALFEQQKWSEAEQAFHQAIELDPAFARAHGELGAALLQQEKWAEAETVCRQAIACDARLALDHRNLGWALFEQRKWAEAEGAYRRATELDPTDAVAQNDLGTALWEQQKWAEAETAFRRAAELDPTDPLYHRNLGEALVKQEKWAEAEEAYRRVTDFNRKGAKGAVDHNQLGFALWRQQKWAEAEKEFRRATELDPEFAVAHHNLGKALYAEEKWAEAEKAYRRAVGLDPNNAKYHYDLGMALFKQRTWAEAETEYHRATDIDPRNSPAHNQLGFALWMQRQWAEAEMEFRRATDIDPRNVVAHGNLGSALLKRRQWAGAEAAFRRAIELDPKNAAAHSGLGKALRWQGQWTEAERAYRAAIAAGDHSPAVAATVPQLQLAAKLHPMLLAYLAGDLRPAGNDERLALAAVCRFECLHASAARFYADAFDADPGLADDLDAFHRDHAACSAARAAAGEGCDAPRDDADKARLRGQALVWLKADLARWGERLAGGKDADRASVRNEMLDWQEDADLAAVRDEKALAALPEAERKEWAGLWADVAGLLQKAGGK
jgi:tetratricopeptide (TPR) repeat protein